LKKEGKWKEIFLSCEQTLRLLNSLPKRIDQRIKAICYYAESALHLELEKSKLNEIIDLLNEVIDIKQDLFGKEAVSE